LTRIVAALAGMLLTQVGYGVRAAVLPDIPAGRAIAAAVVVLALTALSVVTGNRLRLWALLVGAGAFVGAYETVYDASPTTFVADSFSMATAVSLGAALGFTVASLVTAFVTTPAASAQQTQPPQADARDGAFPADLPVQRDTTRTGRTPRTPQPARSEA
jgi:hypothetical protein